MLPKCAIQPDGSILFDSSEPPPDAPLVGGIAVNADTGAIYATEAAPIEETGFDSGFDSGFK